MKPDSAKHEPSQQGRAEKTPSDADPPNQETPPKFSNARPTCNSGRDRHVAWPQFQESSSLGSEEIQSVYLAEAL